MGELDRLLARPEESARDAFERLLADGSSLLVVIDGAGAVVGTVTDSSFRRAALADLSLSMRVEDLMSRRPVVATPSLTDDAIADLLVTHRLRSIPVVSDGRLAGVRSLDEFPDRCPPAPVAVLMVGGEGKRLRPWTDKVPKPLLKIGGSSIVERIIENLAAAGVRRVFLAVNYLAEQFEDRLGDGSDLGVDLTYVREPELMGSAGGLSLLPDVPEGAVFVSNGDLVTTVDYGAMFAYHWRHGGAVTVAGVEHLTHVPYGVLRSVEHHLLGIDEKPERRDFVNAGMYVLDPTVLRFVPPNRPSTMPDLIDETLAEGLPVHVFPILETWSDIGTPEEFERVLLAFATGEEG